MPTIPWSRFRVPLAVVLLAAAGDLRAQEVRLPAQVGPFTMADSSRYEQRALGIMYTYRNTAERVVGNAYVYPVPEEWLQLPEEERVAREAERFRMSLAEGIRQGWYSNVSAPVDTARAWDTADGTRPGHLTVAALRTADGAHVSFMHLVLLGDRFVKTRLTMPVEQWRNSMAPNFGPDLFQQLSAPAPAGDDRPAVAASRASR